MLKFSLIMKFSKLKEIKKDNKNQTFSESLYKGDCVKIKNSRKTFQIIGLDLEKKICWVREWPFGSETRRTFALDVSQIILKLFCSNEFFE